MHTPSRVSISAITIVALFALTPVGPPPDLNAQAIPRLFDDAAPGATPAPRAVPAARARKARLRGDALNATAVSLNMFQDIETVARRTFLDQPALDRFVWHGRTGDGGQATFAVVRGVMTGTVFLEGRSFEITPDPDGDYTIAELNPAAYPTEDPPLDAPDTAADQVGIVENSADTTAAAGVVEMDVLVLWTPAARTAAGGTSAIQSLVLAAVANANLSYTNSVVGARLRLVYSGEVAFTETPTNISGDLGYLRNAGDGKLETALTLRTQYGADVVTLLGNGYAGAGVCGIGYLMGSPSTSFAGNAFNVVDRTCAAGYLSYAHEVGHNQGLHHDPGSAGSTPSYPYAYGYQDPGGLFRTVLSYGSATRIPYLASPAVTYLGRVTGTASQDNARALRNTAPIVAAFKGAATTPPTTSCTYSVSPATLSFSPGAGSQNVAVTTSGGCAWTSASTSWAGVSGSGSGNGTATISVPNNRGGSRTTSVTVAGAAINITQAGKFTGKPK